MERPRVDENVGLAHDSTASLTYVDQLAVDEASLRSGARPVVHSFSNKQRDFNAMSTQQAQASLAADIQEAMSKYGGTLEIRRPGHPLFGRKVVVSKVHLIYDGKLVSNKTMDLLQFKARKADVKLHFISKN